MKKHGSPHGVVTEGLRAYAAASNEIGIADPHEVGPRPSNGAENSHQPSTMRAGDAAVSEV
jgi:putative transposase